MWISNRVADWVSDLKKAADVQADIAKQALADLKEELASVRAERDALKAELTASKINADWLRVQFNQIQAENKALLERAYGIRVPVPELVSKTEKTFNLQDLFNDIGDEEASRQGLPVYGDDKLGE